MITYIYEKCPECKTLNLKYEKVCNSCYRSLIAENYGEGIRKIESVDAEKNAVNVSISVALQKVDENITRLNAAITAIAVLLCLFSPLKWIILIVTVDFFIRGFREQKYSLFVKLSTKIIILRKIKPVMVDASDKIFSTQIGFIFSCLITVAWIFHLRSVFVIVGLFFAVCMVLEAAFSLCLACKIYPIFRDIKLNK